MVYDGQYIRRQAPQAAGRPGGAVAPRGARVSAEGGLASCVPLRGLAPISGAGRRERHTVLDSVRL
eukprot:152876-Pyramimonas_sp.AAC.1